MDKKVGILGGGQLGLMLYQAGMDFPIALHFMDQKGAPCQRYTPNFTEGDIQNYEQVLAFGRQMDVLTIEIEKVNVDALEQLEKEGKTVYPQPRALRIIQDKRLQKQFYAEQGIPTAPFQLIENKAQLAEHEAFLPAFQKLGKDGYDGRGVQALHSAADFEKGFEAPSLIEKAADLDKELSVIVARNPSGEARCFPVVEMVVHPEYNLVDYLLAPARISEAQAEEARALALRVAEAFDITGLLAVELFLNKDGSIWVNEVAPRPHNSGHHSIRANYCSQFEQHLRSLLDWPLGDTQLRCAAAMVNILGEEEATGAAVYPHFHKILQIEGAHPLLYHKLQSKPSRKMGHVAVLGDSHEEVIAKVERLKPFAKSAAE